MRENTILAKLGLPLIRRVNHFEQSINEYGEKFRWVVDAGERQSHKVATTKHDAFILALETLGVFGPEEGALARLTAKERELVEQARR